MCKEALFLGLTFPQCLAGVQCAFLYLFLIPLGLYKWQVLCTVDSRDRKDWVIIYRAKFSVTSQNIWKCVGEGIWKWCIMTWCLAYSLLWLCIIGLQLWGPIWLNKSSLSCIKKIPVLNRRGWHHLILILLRKGKNQLKVLYIDYYILLIVLQFFGRHIID